MRRELEDAAREGSSRRSNSPIPVMPLERAGSLSDLTGNVKAAGFFSDGIPKNIHMKFVSVFFVGKKNQIFEKKNLLSRNSIVPRSNTLVGFPKSI